MSVDWFWKIDLMPGKDLQKSDYKWCGIYIMSEVVTTGITRAEISSTIDVATTTEREKRRSHVSCSIANKLERLRKVSCLAASLHARQLLCRLVEETAGLRGALAGGHWTERAWTIESKATGGKAERGILKRAWRQMIRRGVKWWN